MINDTWFDDLISKKLLEAERLERVHHVSSGKLSASMLGWPLQWQMLKMLGVPMKQNDSYTLRKFLRGKQIEEWLVGQLDAVVKKQMPVEYRGCVGYIDAVVQHNGHVPQIKDMVLPHEVKSVTNMKYKRIDKTKEADPQHKLQACMYALALKKPYYAIDYVASDDLRVNTYVYKTVDLKAEVDKIITEFEIAFKSKTVPTFTPRYDWQKNPMYNNYPEWAELTQNEINKKIKGYMAN